MQYSHYKIKSVLSHPHVDSMVANRVSLDTKKLNYPDNSYIHIFEFCLSGYTDNEYN